MDRLKVSTGLLRVTGITSGKGLWRESWYRGLVRVKSWFSARNVCSASTLFTAVNLPGANQRQANWNCINPARLNINRAHSGLQVCTGYFNLLTLLNSV